MKILTNKQWSSIAEVEDDELNYLVVKNTTKKFFVFNNYKTAKVYHQKKIIDVGTELNKVLNKWLKINTSDYLLLNSIYEPFSKNGLTKFIQKIFGSNGKKVSVSMIRHAYLSSRYNADTQDKASIAESMMHSVSMQTELTKSEQLDNIRTQLAEPDLRKADKQRPLYDFKFTNKPDSLKPLTGKAGKVPEQ